MKKLKFVLFESEAPHANSRQMLENTVNDFLEKSGIVPEQIVTHYVNMVSHEDAVHYTTQYSVSFLLSIETGETK